MRRFFEVPAHVGIYVLAILLAAVQVFDMATRPRPLSQVIETANKSVVAIVCHKDKGLLTAGFVSSDRGYITTVAHGLGPCVKDPAAIEVRFKDEPLSYHAEIVRYNKIVDVAVLRVRHMPHIRALEIVTEAPEAGTRAIALGHPLALFWSASDGIVSADRWSTRPLLHVIQVSCALNPGNSGGPIINEKGQVLGIGDFTIGDSSLGFIVAGDFLKMVAQGLYP